MKTKHHAMRQGNVLVLTMFMMVGAFAILAFAVDLGYINLARTELQRSADAAAIAAAWELVDEDALTGYENPWQLEYQVQTKASQYAALNKVTTEQPTLGVGDVVTGYLANPFGPNSEIVQGTGNPLNAVQVRVRKTAGQNGEIPLFFARMLGINQTSCQAEATAALLNNIRGFSTPSSGCNLMLLPFALKLDTWQGRDTYGTDDWGWDSVNHEVTPTGDGIPEVNLFPQETGSPGNSGTIDIGSSNNSTADIARQIVEGISPAELAYHGGKLELDCSGSLSLNGDTGISAGVKDELASIIGQRRIIPLFSQVSGPGNNAQYTIVCFAGVRIMEVKLTGNMSGKRVMVQPACILAQGAIPADGAALSQFVFSPVWLVR